jgi:hypothetical protein
MNSLKIFSLLLTCFYGSSIFAQTNVQWKMLYPSVWKATIGKPEKISLLSAAEAKPNLKALANLPQTDFPLAKGDMDFKVIDHKTYLRFPLEKEEQLFGLGLNFQTVNQRKRILNLHVDHYGNAVGSFQLYDDDGVSFNYEKGAYSFTKLSVVKGNDGKLKGETISVEDGKPFGYSRDVKWVFMTK